MAEFNLEATEATGLCQVRLYTRDVWPLVLLLTVYARDAGSSTCLTSWEVWNTAAVTLPRLPQLAFQGKAGDLLPAAFGVEAEVDRLVAQAAGQLGG